MTNRGKYLLVGEAQSTFVPHRDTGVALVEELLRRQIPVDYMCVDDADWRRPSKDYLSQLPCRSILASDQKSTPILKLGPVKPSNVEDYDVILQRMDPPVDERYRGHSAQFAQAPKRIVQMNDPAMACFYSEHELPTRYPDYGVPTSICTSFEQFLAAVRAQETEAVLKPANLFGGAGVTFVKRDIPEAELRPMWEKFQPKAIVQPYLDEITKSGDLRILVINQKILGWVLRKPKAGSRLANLHAGGSAVAGHASKRQLEASAAIAKDLCPQGLLLLGLDFIGDFVSEVNITCPTLIVQVNELMNKRADIEIIDELERLRAKAAQEHA